MQIRHSLARVLGVAAMSVALVAALTSPAHAKWHSVVENHTPPIPDDKGGKNAQVRYYNDNSERPDMAVRFQARGEWLKVSAYRNTKTHIQVKVYRPAGGGNLHLVDTDNFTLGAGRQKDYDLGTPDGTGDIAEGYIVGMRIRIDKGPWSDWAHGTA